MSAIESIEHELLFLPWAMWLGTAGAWVWACLYLDSFRGMTARAARRCRNLLTAFGPAFFLGTVQLGVRVTAVGAIAISILIGVALRYGGYVRGLDLAKGTASSETGNLARALWLKIRNWVLDPDALPGGRAPKVLLFKKDGSAYGGADLAGDRSFALPRARKLIEAATSYGATDIHLEPQERGGIQVRYRVDGILQSVDSDELPAAGGPAVLTLFKVLSDIDIAERRRPQDGSFAVTVDGQRFDVRTATSPTQYGEKMVMRILNTAGTLIQGGLSSVGMPADIVQSIRGVIQKPQGMLIVCGPTGSGKTSTVYAALSEMDKLTRNIVTIEDPIEYQLQGVSQIAVNTGADVTFAAILRSVLRQDPDVVLLGEIRDRETAEIAMRAALTGHLVLTTIHANDAPTTVTRLIDMGVDASLIQSTVTGVLAQRLVRILCPICKKSYRSSRVRGSSQDGDVGSDPDMQSEYVLYKPVGCNACLNTGYRGRTGVFEYMAVDGRIRSVLCGKPSLELIRDLAKRSGMVSLRRAAKAKVIQGITSAAEAQRVVV